MTLFTLGINTGFATNRFPEPEEWARIVAQDLHLERVQLVADLLNPFWPQDVLEAEIERIRAATAKYGIRVHSLMTSSFTRVNHLMHPYPEHREAWLMWFKRFADLAAQLGAKAVGSHFGILSFHDLNNPARCRTQVEAGIRNWQELSYYARDVGLEYIYFETMSIPREMADTIGGARDLCDRVNADAGVPMRICLDVGHAPHPQERDPYRWLRDLGDISPIVHLQQTESNHSRHWPFTPEYNAAGLIHPVKVLQALAESGAKEIFLAFEIAHRESYEQDYRVVPDLAQSVAYWRRYLPANGVWEPAVPVAANGSATRGHGA